MVIAGAGGHARELLGILEECHYPHEIFFFDDLTGSPMDMIFGRYKVLINTGEAKTNFSNNPSFSLGVGKPSLRKDLCEKLSAAGGILQSVLSPFARIGANDVTLGEGLNIMTGAVITASTPIGKGTLVHVHCSVHHDTLIG